MNPDQEIKKLERRIEALKAKSHKMDANRKKTALQKALAVVKKFGFDSIHELLEIADTAVVATRTRKRSKIDGAARKSVVAMLKAGETVAVTAKKHNISAPSVNNIKKAAGLTKSKKSRAIKFHPILKEVTSKKAAKEILRHAVTSTKNISRKIYGPKGVARTQKRLKPKVQRRSKTVAAPEVPIAPTESATLKAE
jgi:hypothetical protein